MIDNKLRFFVVCIALVTLPLAGCNAGPSNQSPTDSPTVTATSTSTTTPTPTPTDTLTPFETPDKTQNEKYRAFAGAYVEAIEGNNVNVLDHTVGSNGTIHLSYEMKNHDNRDVTGTETQNVTLLYVATVDVYEDEENTEVDETWVPKRVNITAKTAGGQVYRTGHMKYEWAVEMTDGDADAFDTMVKFYNTTEYGPGHPDHGE